MAEKGRTFWDVLAAMWRWGDDWLFDDGPGRLGLVDPETSDEIRPRAIDEATGRTLELGRTRVRRRRPAAEPG